MVLNVLVDSLRISALRYSSTAAKYTGAPAPTRSASVVALTKKAMDATNRKL